MNDHDITNLELQIETLLQGWKQSKQENILLRQRIERLTQERAELLEKNAHLTDKKQKIVTKIKRIILHLRNETS